MQRPTGITIIAILFFIGAFFFLMAALAAGVGTGVAGLGAAGAPGLGLLAGLGIVATVVLIALAAAYAAIGWGLLQLKEWARMVALLLTFVGAGFTSFGLLASLFAFEILSLLWQACWLAVHVVIIRYLMSAPIKAAFAGGTPPPMPLVR